MSSKRNSPAYQAWLVGLLSVNFGIVFFDRNSLNFLMPFVQPDLHLSISHAMVASEVDPTKRGLAQGVAQNFGSNFFGSFVAPVVLVWLAQEYGWREAFYIAGIPGLSCAALIWFT